MTDLDRLLELKLELSVYSGYEYDYTQKHNEFRSLYEKLKKAEGYYDMAIDKDLEQKYLALKQNQKTPEDIEKIEWINKSGYDFSQLNMMLANYQKRCQSIDEITKGQEEWKLKYFDLQKEIQKLSEDNKQLKEEIIILKSASSYDAKSIIKLQQDSKTNAEIVENLKQYLQDNEHGKFLQSILKETK